LIGAIAQHKKKIFKKTLKSKPAQVRIAMDFDEHFEIDGDILATSAPVNVDHIHLLLKQVGVDICK